ncbi:hypothetical protein SAMN05421878_105108 [Actinobaculum suis]|uniref:Uncharacterized protein n=1 Tax=Actinobaculum suis TaxID=1657 RepID=A0A1G7BRE1_9ACTO|nr:hypothetical protein SAMN05421878_105108 [Actinobaculum suis]
MEDRRFSMPTYLPLCARRMFHLTQGEFGQGFSS